jgi:hypothetical protein
MTLLLRLVQTSAVVSVSTAIVSTAAVKMNEPWSPSNFLKSEASRGLNRFQPGRVVVPNSSLACSPEIELQGPQSIELQGPQGGTNVNGLNPQDINSFSEFQFPDANEVLTPRFSNVNGPFSNVNGDYVHERGSLFAPKSADNNHGENIEEKTQKSEDVGVVAPLAAPAEIIKVISAATKRRFEPTIIKPRVTESMAEQEIARPSHKHEEPEQPSIQPSGALKSKTEKIPPSAKASQHPVVKMGNNILSYEGLEDLGAKIRAFEKGSQRRQNLQETSRKAAEEIAENEVANEPYRQELPQIELPEIELPQISSKTISQEVDLPPLPKKEDNIIPLEVVRSDGGDEYHDVNDHAEADINRTGNYYLFEGSQFAGPVLRVAGGTDDVKQAGDRDPQEQSDAKPTAKPTANTPQVEPKAQVKVEPCSVQDNFRACKCRIALTKEQIRHYNFVPGHSWKQLPYLQRVPFSEEREEIGSGTFGMVYKYEMRGYGDNFHNNDVQEVGRSNQGSGIQTAYQESRYNISPLSFPHSTQPPNEPPTEPYSFAGKSLNLILTNVPEYREYEVTEEDVYVRRFMAMKTRILLLRIPMPKQQSDINYPLQLGQTPPQKNRKKENPHKRSRKKFSLSPQVWKLFRGFLHEKKVPGTEETWRIAIERAKELKGLQNWLQQAFSAPSAPINQTTSLQATSLQRSINIFGKSFLPQTTVAFDDFLAFVVTSNQARSMFSSSEVNTRIDQLFAKSNGDSQSRMTELFTRLKAAVVNTSIGLFKFDMESNYQYEFSCKSSL